MQGDALCDLAEVLHAAGRGDEAAGAFAQALERYERKHDLAHAAQVRDRLEEVRRRPAPRSAAATQSGLEDLVLDARQRAGREPAHGDADVPLLDRARPAAVGGARPDDDARSVGGSPSASMLPEPARSALLSIVTKKRTWPAEVMVRLRLPSFVLPSRVSSCARSLHGSAQVGGTRNCT